MAAVEYYGTGRRKTSTARVFLRPGTGAITVNHREFANYFPAEALRFSRDQSAARDLRACDVNAAARRGRCRSAGSSRPGTRRSRAFHAGRGDGHLDVETEPGKGSCFRVTLPVKSGHELFR